MHGFGHVLITQIDSDHSDGGINGAGGTFRFACARQRIELQAHTEILVAIDFAKRFGVSANQAGKA
jgi:hypothetical protein